MCIPVSVCAHYNEEFELKIKYLFLSFQLIPSKNKKNKKQKVKKNKSVEKAKDENSSKKGSNKKKKSNILTEFYYNNGFFETVDLIKDAAGVLKDYLHSLLIRHLVIKHFYLQLIVAGDDCAETAEKFGKLSAAVYPSLAFLDNHLKIKDRIIVIKPDFIDEENSARFSLKLSVKPFWIINSSLYFALRLLKRFIKVTVSNTNAKRNTQKFIAKSQAKPFKYEENANETSS